MGPFHDCKGPQMKRYASDNSYKADIGAAAVNSHFVRIAALGGARSERPHSAQLATFMPPER